MQIESLAVALPSLLVRNDDVLGSIAENNGELDKEELHSILRTVKAGLNFSGAKERYWLSEDETSKEMALNACRKALSGVDSSEIDMVIHASVYTELIEPSSANLFAAELGLKNAEVFDLKEACEGFMKAAKIAEAFLATGYRKILIINSEFSLVDGYAIRPALYHFNSKEELKWRLPAYTIGEAATAVVLSADERNNWNFHNKTRNDLFDLCSVPAPWFPLGAEGRSRVGKDGPGVFTSWGAELTAAGVPLAVETFRESNINPDDVDVLFTHCSSKRDWANIAEQIGLSEKIYDIYERYGNVVSAGVPAAMALAKEEGKLRRGMRVAILVASAGMTFSTAHFTY